MLVPFGGGGGACPWTIVFTQRLAMTGSKTIRNSISRFSHGCVGDGQKNGHSGSGVADCRISRRYCTANTKTLLPRFASIWLLPPAATAMYCVPPTMYETAGALTPAPQLNFHSSRPFLAS